MRADCGSSITIAVTTGGIGIDYKHRPIHQAAPVRRVDEGLKELIRTKQFASARELCRYLQHDRQNETLHQYTSAQLYYWWAFYNKSNYCRQEDEFISSEMLLADRDQDGFNIIHGLTERGVSLAWTLPFWNDDVVDVPTSMSLPFQLFPLPCHHRSPSLPLTWLNHSSQRNLCGCHLQNEPPRVRALLCTRPTNVCFYPSVLSAS
jgi:hypothetical protein